MPTNEPLLNDQRRKEILRQCLSVGVATGAYGISFGALSVAAGLDLWQTIALSALLFSGASQFAVVGIVAAGGSGAAAVATSTLLGLRNGLYGLQVSRLLGASGLRRVAAAQLTIDESTAVAVAQPERSAQRLGFWGTGLAVFVLWNLTTILGAVVGNALGDPKTVRSGRRRAGRVLRSAVAAAEVRGRPRGGRRLSRHRTRRGPSRAGRHTGPGRRPGRDRGGPAALAQSAGR